MQKTNQKASILIWAIFLSVVISISFLGISTKIHKNIKNSGDFIDTIDTQSEIANYIASGSLSQTYIDRSFGNNITLEFEDNTNIFRGISAGEVLELQSNTGSNTLNINIISGGPIYYEIEENNIITSSDTLVNGATNMDLSQAGVIHIKSLGGLSKINILSSEGLLAKETHYTISRKIGNLESIQTQGKITNF